MVWWLGDGTVSPVEYLYEYNKGLIIVGGPIGETSIRLSMASIRLSMYSTSIRVSDQPTTLWTLCRTREEEQGAGTLANGPRGALF